MDEISSKELLSFVRSMNRQYVKDNQIDISINSFSSLGCSKKGSISFIKKDSLDLNSVECNILIVPTNFIKTSERILLIYVNDPRLVFLRILKKYFVLDKFDPSIDKSCFIHPDSKLGKSPHIMQNVIIAEHVTIGDNVKIYPNVVIYKNVKIGNHVVIHSNSVLGNDGFGYEKNENGEYENFPHFGGVRIEDFVEIGANTTINAGSIDDTVVGRGTKVDDHCYIAHNAVIGKNCILTAGTLIFGSVICEDNVWFGPGVITKNKIHIGKNSFLGAGSVVIKDVPSGKKIVGNPGRELESYD